MKVDKNLLIKAHYTLTTVAKDAQETEVEKTSPDMPLVYIQGMGLMLPDFEANLLGLDEGDSFDFVLTPEQAYGIPSDDYITTLPKDIFLVEGKFDEEIVYVGGKVPMMDSDGNQLIGTVLEINDEGVKMDFNHELAGETLHFVGTVAEVSVPTAEEAQSILGGGGGGCSGCSGDGGCSGCH